MGNRFSSGKNSIAECDRCGFRYKLSELRREVIKTKNYDLLVCPTCWEPDHPQLQLGMYPVDDPQGVRNPRMDNSYAASGLLADGYLGEGSRVTQWGWGPVGGPSSFTSFLGIPNNLETHTAVGSGTISTTIYTPGTPVENQTFLITDSGKFLVTDSGAYLITG